MAATSFRTWSNFKSESAQFQGKAGADYIHSLHGVIRRCAMMDAAPGPATKFTVTVEVPGTVHDVPMQKLKAWLEGSGRSPAEQAVKVRLREMLGSA